MLQKIAASQSAAIMVLDHPSSPSQQDCTVKFNTIPALPPLIPDQVQTAETQLNNSQGHPGNESTPNLLIKQHYGGGTIADTRVLLTAVQHKGRSCGFFTMQHQNIFNAQVSGAECRAWARVAGMRSWMHLK